MKRSIKFARKVVVAMIGLPLLVIGIILIPLPGPGVLITFLALFVLSLEFEQVERPLGKLKNELKQMYRRAKKVSEKIETL